MPLSPYARNTVFPDRFAHDCSGRSTGQNRPANAQCFSPFLFEKWPGNFLKNLLIDTFIGTKRVEANDETDEASGNRCSRHANPTKVFTQILIMLTIIFIPWGKSPRVWEAFFHTLNSRTRWSLRILHEPSSGPFYDWPGRWWLRNWRKCRWILVVFISRRKLNSSTGLHGKALIAQSSWPGTVIERFTMQLPYIYTAR